MKKQFYLREVEYDKEHLTYCRFVCEENRTEKNLRTKLLSQFTN